MFLLTILSITEIVGWRASLLACLSPDSIAVLNFLIWVRRLLRLLRLIARRFVFCLILFLADL
jgi:hypothetical protein